MRPHAFWMATVAVIALPTCALAQAPAPAPSSAAAPAKPATSAKPAGTVGEVVVTGQAPPMQTAIDRKTYNVSSDLRAQTGSIGDALRNVPSVEVDVQGNLSLRGDPNVTILVDGKPSGQFQGEGKGQALQSLPADRIERVEVITNPSAEFRADGTAGIINLVTKTAKGAGQTGSLRLNLATGDRAQVSGNIGYNSKALSLTADAFYRHDTQKQATDEDRARLDASTGTLAGSRIDGTGKIAVDIASLRGQVDYDADPKTRLSLEARGQYFEFNLDNASHTEREDGHDVLVQVFDRAVRVHQERENGELTGTLRRKLDGEGHDLVLSASYEATEEDRTRYGGTFSRTPLMADAFDRQHVLISLGQAEVKGDYTRPMPDGAKLKAGFDLQFDDNSYDNRGFGGPTSPGAVPNPTLTNLFEYRQRLSQAYVTYERPFGDLTVLAGLRLEDVRLDLDQVTLGQKADNDYAKAYPSLHVNWKLSDSQQLSASYSHRVQRPQPEEFNAFRFFIDPLTFKSGNTDLKPQETHAYELGYQYRHRGTYYLATAYYRENFNGVSDVVRDLGGGVFLTTRENVSDTRNGGLELVAAGRLTKTVTYNLSGNAYWSELDAGSLGFTGTRSTVSLSGRANLNWQVTPNDFVQLNGFVNGKRLTPQGFIEPTGMLNIGYRHKFNDRVSGLITVQDVLGTFNYRQVVDTPALKTRIAQNVDTRFFLVGVVWTFGGGRQRDPGFDFQSSGPAPQ